MTAVCLPPALRATRLIYGLKFLAASALRFRCHGFPSRRSTLSAGSVSGSVAGLCALQGLSVLYIAATLLPIKDARLPLSMPALTLRAPTPLVRDLS